MEKLDRRLQLIETHQPNPNIIKAPTNHYNGYEGRDTRRRGSKATKTSTEGESKCTAHD